MNINKYTKKNERKERRRRTSEFIKKFKNKRVILEGFLEPSKNANASER